MAQKQALQLFYEKQIRTAWDENEEKWYFSIVDVVAVLTESADSQAYWRKLKQRLKAEGDETVTNCHALKMPASDGKMRLTDVADQVQMFRLIQSIPSPKAEPFKVWMAQVASERIDEIQDPELAIDRGIEYYRKKGYGEGWIAERMKGKEARKALTDEWKRTGVKDSQYASCFGSPTVVDSHPSIPSPAGAIIRQGYILSSHYGHLFVVINDWIGRLVTTARA